MTKTLARAPALESIERLERQRERLVADAASARARAEQLRGTLPDLLLEARERGEGDEEVDTARDEIRRLEENSTLYRQTAERLEAQIEDHASVLEQLQRDLRAAATELYVQTLRAVEPELREGLTRLLPILRRLDAVRHALPSRDVVNLPRVDLSELAGLVARDLDQAEPDRAGRKAAAAAAEIAELMGSVRSRLTGIESRRRAAQATGPRGPSMSRLPDVTVELSDGRVVGQDHPDALREAAELERQAMNRNASGGGAVG